ncbi:MAG: hypothetical protein SP1CHLAM54_10340 [Chlamydiia bacterium]|nr:hypothetical protein [Chlamydiia bacterium]MCH9615939.1 hypothetical protein [Chlamydiia bacterium]MCH9628658.1 hypothetical protein [Chlamydiia bacterium]
MTKKDIKKGFSKLLLTLHLRKKTRCEKALSFLKKFVLV